MATVDLYEIGEMNNMSLDTSLDAIGARIRAVRKARGLTQSALATALDLTPQRYHNYDSGRSCPPASILAKLWQVTGATSDFILFGRLDGMSFDLANALSTSDKDSETRDSA